MSEEYSFVSCSRSLETAMDFSGENCCILKFMLPKSIKNIQLSKLPPINEEGETIKDYEKEILLERNIIFTNIQYLEDDSKEWKSLSIFNK